MLATKIVEFSDQIACAVENSDLEKVQGLTKSADLYLHQHLPLPINTDEDLSDLAVAMETLSSQFQAAMSLVESAREDAHKSLLSVGKNRKDTNKYLDIARTLSN